MTLSDFAHFAEVFAEATLLVDGRGIVLTANRAAATMLGCRAADLIAQPLVGLTSGGAAAVAELIRIGARSPQRLIGALSFHVTDGPLVHTRCEYAAVQARADDRPAWIMVRLYERHEAIERFSLLNQRIDDLSKEVARRRDAEAKLESFSAQLIEAGQRKDEFLAMLAHELRNPLAPMTMGVDLLESLRSSDPNVDRVSTMMRRQLGHLTRLVDDLLDVARLTHGKIELRKQPVLIDEVVRQAVEMFRAKAEEQGLQLRLDLIAQPLRVVADAARLVQVVGNLLSNSVKFGRAGGDILISTRCVDGGVAVSVRDDGAGIDAELLPRVFDLFVQADRSLDRRHGGLGVGLTVVRSIVELHGGTVASFSAGIDQGTEIVVWLPLHADGSAPVLPPPPSPEMLASVPVAELVTAKLNVLVVDDNADAAEALREILTLWGYEADSVGDVAAALALWPQRQINVALLDIGLPGMSGHELARQFRQLADGRPLLMLAISGYGRPADIQASRDAGFDDHLVKPVDLRLLENRLAGHAASLRARPSA